MKIIEITNSSGDLYCIDVSKIFCAKMSQHELNGEYEIIIYTENTTAILVNCKTKKEADKLYNNIKSAILNK